MKLAIITGTRRGLGKALAEVFTDNGWDLEPSDKKYTRVVFINNGFRMHIQKASLLDDDIVNRNIQENIAQPIIRFAGTLRQYPYAEFVNVSSSAAIKPIAHWALYCTGKAAMESYCRVLQAEGVKCLNYDPGAMDTDMQKLIRSSDFPEVARFHRLRFRDVHIVAQELFDKIN